MPPLSTPCDQLLHLLPEAVVQTDAQIDAVSAFLAWALETLPFHNEVQLERALLRWASGS